MGRILSKDFNLFNMYHFNTKVTHIYILGAYIKTIVLKVWLASVDLYIK